MHDLEGAAEQLFRVGKGRRAPDINEIIQLRDETEALRQDMQALRNEYQVLKDLLLRSKAKA